MTRPFAKSNKIVNTSLITSTTILHNLGTQDSAISLTSLIKALMASPGILNKLCVHGLALRFRNKGFLNSELHEIIWKGLCSSRDKKFALALFLFCLASLLVLFPPGGFDKDGIAFAANSKTSFVVSHYCSCLSIAAFGYATGVFAFSTPGNLMELHRLLGVICPFVLQVDVGTSVIQTYFAYLVVSLMNASI
ncbi:unnamed protein product [Arabidopsis halleri]